MHKKLSIKMFIKKKKKKNRAGKAYTYRMLLSFETPTTYKKIFTFTPGNVEQLSSDIIRFLARHYPISRAKCSGLFIVEE